MDELGSSRRAAFRAVHDEGWIPLLYEIEPDEWLAAQRRTSNKEEDPDQETQRKSVNERLTIKNLLQPADHFIGIYGTSLGDPTAQFNGLRPLEYEILYFLIAHVLRRQGKDLDALADIFRQSTSPEGFRAARNRLRDALVGIRRKSSDSHKVFCERMALFLKEPPSDVPASSLMYSTLHRLYRSSSRSRVKFFKSGITTLPTGVVYWRPSSQLYLKIRLQIQQWRRNQSLPSLSREQGPEFCMKIVTRPNLGFVFNIVKAIFYEGYNVRKLRLGVEPDGDRVMHMKVGPYLHAGNDKELITNLSEKCNCVVERAGKIPVLPPLPSQGRRWRLDIILADRPGMLARALAPLAHSEMQVLDIRIDVDKTKMGVRGPRNLIEVTFKKAKRGQRKGEVIDKGLQLPKDPQFALDFIAADLTSQPGFYSVILSTIQSKSHRRGRA